MKILQRLEIGFMVAAAVSFAANAIVLYFIAQSTLAGTYDIGRLRLEWFCGLFSLLFMLLFATSLILSFIEQRKSHPKFKYKIKFK
jgi:preprotein translocase subunit SecG